MTAVGAKLRTALALGLPNIARVALYRGLLRASIHPVQRLHASVSHGSFFPASGELPPVAAEPVDQWRDSALLFGRHSIPITSDPPDWASDPLSGAAPFDATLDWWRIPDFVAGADIKLVWELSRMDWAIAFAERARTGDAESLRRLNAWLNDWCARNPPFKGPNWKCAQEASIRVIHLAASALVLGQQRSSAPALLDLVSIHLSRIAPTLGYAGAQDNNHATSEAAAMFIGGSWLAAHGRTAGKAWSRTGRERLERSVARLVAPDGSFSQYSLNYHRVLLDTLSFAETWRRTLGLEAFSERWRGRAGAATDWLEAMIDPASGDGPNLGANDGARLLQVARSGYRDYRPSVQLASALFRDSRAYPPGRCDDALEWLGVDPPERPAAPLTGKLFDDGGYAVLRSGQARAVLRYPRFRFRPSQADPLHVDFWLGRENVLRDGGTFSYAADPEMAAYFGGVASHNTVQFDDDEPMPRLGRFLLADWLWTNDRGPLDDEGRRDGFHAAYRDYRGRSHRRRIRLGQTGLDVRDEVAGFSQKAVLRWRLSPGSWRLDEHGAVCGADRITVEASQPISRMEIVKGLESRHYLELSDIPVLEVEIGRPGMFESSYQRAA